MQVDDDAQQARSALMSGAVELPRVGAVRAQNSRAEPFMLVDDGGCVVEPVGSWLRELVLNDQSSRTVRSYAFALLTWHRMLWFVGTPWNRAGELDTAALVGWMRLARNPQRQRSGAGSPPGAVNLRTGKQSLGIGYSAATINLTLAAVHGFYGFHQHLGQGPV